MRRPSRISSLMLAAALTAVGCARVPGGQTPRQVTSPDSVGIADPPRHSGRPVLFIAMPGSASFQATRKGLLGELASSYDFVTFLVKADTTLAEFGAALDAAHPTCLMIMNNSSLRLYRDYQRTRKGQTFPPAVVAMTSFLEDIRGELGNTTGISYEVPGVTAFVALRSVVKTPVSRVGVVHAPYSRGFIQRQRDLAAKEHVELYPIEVSNQPTLVELRNALHYMKDVNHVDTMWVLNDNRLLRDGRLLLDVWQPELEALNVPVIVGAAPLVSAQAAFGTFAVLPDHAALGVQAANLILDLAEDGWDAAHHPIELPLATTSVLDVARARARFGLRDDALKYVDQMVE